MTQIRLSKELATAEQVALLGSQTVRHMSQVATFRAVTAKAFEQLMTKMQARLSSNMVTIFSHGYVVGAPEAGHEGMQMLTRLRAIKSKLDHLSPVVAAMNDANIPGKDLVRAVVTCSDQVELPNDILETGLQRLLEEQFAKGK